MGRTILACLALACALAGSANAAPGLLVGVADDTLKWSDKPTAQRALNYTRDLGIRAVRVTVPWQPGQTGLGVLDRKPIDRMILSTWNGGLRVVLAVYGKPDDAPRTDQARNDYCAFVSSLLHRYPGVSDVVIWNEPNSSRFWRPQYGPDGTSLAPADYEALLARCWDVLHAARANVNVIAASSPRGNDNPAASSNVGHSPATFYRKLGLAYRASGRQRPILDTVGHNPYPVSNAERPWVRHPAGGTIAEGDYDKLMSVLDRGVRRHRPSRCPARSAWRSGTWSRGSRRRSTRRRRASTAAPRPSARRFPPGSRATTTSLIQAAPAPDQATQLSDALQVAYCQPAVAAFFNFELADEANLGGWQSGLLWTDLTPKPSYAPFRDAVRRVAAGNVDCSRFTGGVGFSKK